MLKTKTISRQKQNHKHWKTFSFLFFGIAIQLILIVLIVPKTASQAQDTGLTCNDVLTSDLPSEKAFDGGRCADDYITCTRFPFDIPDGEGYGSCINRGGCWDITHSSSLTFDYCPIDWDNNLDYDSNKFKPPSTHHEGNLKFCECVAECFKKYRIKKDCRLELENCCNALITPEQHTPEINDPIPTETFDTIDSPADDLTDLCQDEENNRTQIEEDTKDLMAMIAMEIKQHTDIRTDLSNSQKTELTNLVTEVTDNAIIAKCAEGSKVDACSRWFWSGTCMHIDPMSSPDIIRHEIAHLVVETFFKGFTEPQSESSHDMMGFCSSYHRAFDEALANLVSADLIGKSTYVTFSQSSTVDPLEALGGDQGYVVDFDKKTIEEYEGSVDSPKFHGFDNERDLDWTGITDEKARAKAQKRLDDTSTAYEKLRKEYYDKIESGAILDDSDRVKIKYLSSKLELYSMFLYPPSYSSKNEVAVASLISNLLPGQYKLGRIIESANRFYEKTSRAPKNENDWLQGYVEWQYRTTDEDKENIRERVILLTNNDTHQRGYIEFDLTID